MGWAVNVQTETVYRATCGEGSGELRCGWESNGTTLIDVATTLATLHAEAHTAAWEAYNDAIDRTGQIDESIDPFRVSSPRYLDGVRSL